MASPIDYAEEISKRFNNRITLDPSKVVFVKSKITFNCSEHGSFVSTIDSVRYATYGCPECAVEGKAKKRMDTLEDVVRKAVAEHGTKYSYLQLVGKYIYYTCPSHGTIKQGAADHIQGKGCRFCGQLNSSLSRRITFDEAVSRASRVHGDRYKYKRLLHIEIGKNPTLVYECPLHGEVRQDLQNHLSGKHCPSCGIGFLNKALPIATSVYIVYFTKLKLWKLGVTIHSTSRRFSGEPEKYRQLLYVTLPTGEEAYKLEEVIASILKPLKYTGPKVLRSGNTELYTNDIVDTTINIINNMTFKV